MNIAIKDLISWVGIPVKEMNELLFIIEAGNILALLTTNPDIIPYVKNDIEETKRYFLDLFNFSASFLLYRYNPIKLKIEPLKAMKYLAEIFQVATELFMSNGNVRYKRPKTMGSQIPIFLSEILIKI